MLHLFHLGPLVLGERRLWLLSGVTEEGGFTRPLLGSDLPSGLAAFSARYGPSKLCVEPALEGVAAPFDIPAAPLPESALPLRAVLAFGFLTSHRLFRRPSTVGTFLEACAEFETAAPWTRCRADEPFGILMAERWRCWKREFVVRGRGGEARGLELHEKPGYFERVRQARNSMGILPPPKVDSLLVTFDPGPPWAVEAIRAAYRLPAVPTVIRLRPGSRHAPEPLELLQLAAALRSAALLGGEDASADSGAQIALSADRYELEAVAAPFSGPRVVAAAVRAPPEVPRNAPCPCGSGLKFKRCHRSGAQAASGAAGASV